MCLSAKTQPVHSPVEHENLMKISNLSNIKQEEENMYDGHKDNLESSINESSGMDGGDNKSKENEAYV